MITVKIGETTFICSTASEAVLVHRLASNQPGQGQSTAQPDPGNARMDGQYADLLKKLQAANGKDLDAATMAKYLGVDSPNGVGPRLAKIKKELEAQSPPVLLDDLWRKRKGPKGTIWTVYFNSPSKPE